MATFRKECPFSLGYLEAQFGIVSKESISSHDKVILTWKIGKYQFAFLKFVEKFDLVNSGSCPLKCAEVNLLATASFLRRGQEELEVIKTVCQNFRNRSWVIKFEMISFYNFKFQEFSLNVQPLKNYHSPERVTIDHFSATNSGFKNIVFPKLPSSGPAGKKVYLQIYIKRLCRRQLSHPSSVPIWNQSDLHFQSNTESSHSSKSEQKWKWQGQFQHGTSYVQQNLFWIDLSQNIIITLQHLDISTLFVPIKQLIMSIKN